MRHILPAVVTVAALPTWAERIECTRNLHDYAGEQNHIALTQGRVAYTWWWANMGQAHELRVVTCDTLAGFAVRTHEINMTSDAPFDRRVEAWELLDQMEGSGFFLTLDQMKDRFADKRFKTKALDEEDVCACAEMEAMQ